jgi:hypothetical protein
MQLYVPGMRKCGEAALTVIDKQDLRTADTFKGGAAVLSGSAKARDKRSEQERLHDNFAERAAAR